MKSAQSNAPTLHFFCLGYVGPRVFGASDRGNDPWKRQLDIALAAVATGVRARLLAHRPLCVVGALAQGADLAVAESMLAHGAVLRAWLPEPLDRFVNDADFPDARDRARVAALAEHAELAELRVVSDASERRDRFAECAEAIVRDSDALLCVRHWDAVNARGGTEETLALASALGRPVIEVRLDPNPDAEARVVFPATWTAIPGAGALPFPRPDPRKIVAEWKAAASEEARRSKGFIVRAAAWTVGLQLFATLFAVLTFEKASWDVPSLLVKTAVILTAAGIALTSARRGVSARWAGRRLTAELQRSWWAVRGLPGAASWFEDDLPVEFVGHGRDLALFHGIDRRAEATVDSADFRERYARERIAGQREYAERSASSASRGKLILQGLFYACIALTLVALFTKLGLRATHAVESWEGLDKACSVISILGPTVGGALVSFVALFDLSSRRETQKRLAEFLAEQERRLAACTDWTSTRHVVLATERRLLSETKTWYARHAFSK